MPENQAEANVQGNAGQAEVHNPSSSVQNVKADNVDIDQSHTEQHFHNSVFVIGQADSMKILRGPSGDPFENMMGSFEDDSDLALRFYAKQAQATAQNTVLTGEDVGTPQTKVKPPETLEEIRCWYCEKLTDWEIYFVQAAAVLHGSPVYQIWEAAATLAPESLPVSRVPEDIFFEHTCTKIVYVDGADRLFWYDANSNGLSSFAALVLSVVVRQSNLSMPAQQGQHFLKHLEQWSTTLSGECGWRATRALGSVWRKLHEARLRSIANARARSDNPDDWRRVATLLDGAYEVEYTEHGEQVDQGNNSLVLDLLARWTREAHASFQTNIGSTIAQTYARIGQRSPETALRGLDTLLHYPLRSKDDAEVTIPLLVFVNATWSYVTLARFGYAREVVSHMATLVTKYSYQRRSPLGKERREYLAQCRLILEATFHAFFLIAAAAQSGIKSKVPGNYKRSAKLPEPPIISSQRNQNMLLAGILSSEETAWRQHIMTILCAAILEKNAEPAFYLMHVWAELTLNELGVECGPLRETYLSFLVEAEAKGNQWCTEMARAGEYQYANVSRELYKETLERWQEEGRRNATFLGAFAKDVARRLKA